MRARAKISLIQYTNKPQEYKAAEDELLPVAEAIANHWQPKAQWSQLALFLARDSPIFMIATGTLLIGTILYALYLQMNARKRAKYVYHQLSDPEDREILDALRTIEEKPVTVSELRRKIMEDTGIDIKPEILYNHIIKAEETGLIERQLVNVNDQPYLSWKPLY